MPNTTFVRPVASEQRVQVAASSATTAREAGTGKGYRRAHLPPSGAERQLFVFFGSRASIHPSRASSLRVWM